MFYFHFIFSFVFLAHAKVLDLNAVKQERLRILEASSIADVRDFTFSNCTNVYKSAEWIRGLEFDFLLTFRQESQTSISHVQNSLSALGVDEVRVTQLQFLLDVTHEQVSEIVETNIQLLQEFMHMCKLTCQNLDTMTIEELKTLAADIKSRTNEIKIKFFLSQRDISDMCLEFYEFVQAMMQEIDNDENEKLHEFVDDVQSMFEEMYKKMYRHKSFLTGARRDLVTSKIAFIKRLSDLAYKTQSMQFIS